MAYNADDEKQVKKARKQADIDKAFELDVIRNVMQSIPGRKWIYTLLSRCHIYSTPFSPGQQDVTDFKCGEQNIGNQLLADVQSAAPTEYMQMIAEAKGTAS